MGGAGADLADLLGALKRAAAVLRQAGIPFAVAGGMAVYARGGSATDHDVDLLIREPDREAALAALDEAGFGIETPAEDWLVKAYADQVLVDLIYRPVNRPVTDEVLADTDELSIAAVMLPVLSATQLMVHNLLTLTAQECDLTGPLSLFRAIREQIDVERLRTEVKDSPYARAAPRRDRTAGPRHGAGPAYPQ